MNDQREGSAQQDKDQLTLTDKRLLRELQTSTLGTDAVQACIFKYLLTNTASAIVVTNADRDIVMINPAFSRITGYCADDVLGKNPRIRSSSLHDVKFYQDMWLAINRFGVWSGEIMNRRKSGEIYPERLTIIAVKNSNGEVINYLGEFIDVSSKKADDEKIEHLAHYDTLTGLGNRTLLVTEITRILKNNATNRSMLVGIIYVDLDRFKTINNSFGHHVGDEYLKRVASILRKSVRTVDVIARLGGNEFAIVLGNINSTALKLISQKLLKNLEEVYVIAGHKVSTTASIGISIYPLDALDADALIDKAEIAMYHVKNLGKNNFYFYESDIEINNINRAKIESGFQHALDGNEYRLYFQPQLEIKTGKICGAEALIRWFDRHHNIILPDTFIKIAEESNMILKINNWVVLEAIRTLASWKENDDMNSLTLAINIPTIQFTTELTNQLSASIAQNSIVPHLIKLELTENILIENFELAQENIDRLRALGFQVALDDFGTGYSSLNYLGKLHLDELKIDKSFIMHLVDDPIMKAIVSAIIALAHGLNLTVVAEGVETEEQLQILTVLECDKIQGFLIQPPIPVEDFELFVKNYNTEK